MGKTRRRTDNKIKNKTIKKDTYFQNIVEIKGNISVNNIDNKTAVLINQEKKTKIELVKKFNTGKSGDYVYIIKEKKNKYVMKIFVNDKYPNNEIKLHYKHCEIFQTNMMVPKIFSSGTINNVPFSEKLGDFNYIIMEYIAKSRDLSSYIQKNCKSIEDKAIDSYKLALQLFYYLAMINKNKVKHCDMHTKNILIIKSKTDLILDFTFLNGNKINVGKFHIKIIDFGISESNKNCIKNRRIIGSVMNDIKTCNAFVIKDFIHIKKDALSMLYRSFNKNFKPKYYINEDLYIFVKILRLLNLMTDKLNNVMIDEIEKLVTTNETQLLLKKIYDILVL
tara:strand:+ start:1144 stop:2151 length:1008 start_codon:yes stop_codon:yes gene_type:complete